MSIYFQIQGLSKLRIEYRSDYGQADSHQAVQHIFKRPLDGQYLRLRKDIGRL